MRTNRTLWWTLYASGAIAALLALAWISHALVESEDERLSARAESERQSAMRLALWRMDSWLAPHLAREAARPYFEYMPFVPHERAYTRLLNRVQPGDVLSPSPLLNFDSEFFPLHFQLDDSGTLSSPQVPRGNQLDLAQGSIVTAEAIERKQALLEQLEGRLSLPSLQTKISLAQSGLTNWLATVSDDNAYATSALTLGNQRQRSQQELQKRAEVNLANPQTVAQQRGAIDWQQLDVEIMQAANDANIETSVLLGPFLPTWLGESPGADPAQLCFVREVEIGGHRLVQGFTADWSRLCAALLADIRDLFPGVEVSLVRADLSDEAVADRLLATLPAALEVGAPPVAPHTRLSPARVTLTITWIAAVLGLLGLGLSLRATIAYGTKRSRFASSVTHELRTPLTTFRMYTEMLATGMVAEEKHGHYLETLRRESDRLSILVENVLAYARLEDGRARFRREELSVPELVERSAAVLERRVEDVGGTLRLDVVAPSTTLVATDSGAVGQILFNLVDNACKYGHADGPPEILLEAVVEGQAVSLRVRDHGPGIPPAIAARIFRPFDRGSLPAADPNPGIGLGLALARGLARDLGGELLLEDEGAGASFRLDLPVAS